MHQVQEIVRTIKVIDMKTFVMQINMHVAYSFPHHIKYMSVNS